MSWRDWPATSTICCVFASLRAINYAVFLLCILLSSDSLSGCGFERIIDNEAGFCPPLVQRTPSERGHESPERRQGEEIIQYLPLPPPEEDKQSAQVLCSKGRIVTRYRIWQTPCHPIAIGSGESQKQKKPRQFPARVRLIPITSR